MGSWLFLFTTQIYNFRYQSAPDPVREINVGPPDHMRHIPFINQLCSHSTLFPTSWYKQNVPVMWYLHCVLKHCTPVKCACALPAPSWRHFVLYDTSRVKWHVTRNVLFKLLSHFLRRRGSTRWLFLQLSAVSTPKRDLWVVFRTAVTHMPRIGQTPT